MIKKDKGIKSDYVDVRDRILPTSPISYIPNKFSFEMIKNILYSFAQFIANAHPHSANMIYEYEKDQKNKEYQNKIK